MCGSSKLFAIVGVGPNDVEMTAMICASKEEAEAEIVLRGAEPGKFIPEEKAEEVGSKFFTSYYGGCGDADKYVVREISLGVPFASWDLD